MLVFNDTRDVPPGRLESTQDIIDLVGLDEASDDSLCGILCTRDHALITGWDDLSIRITDLDWLQRRGRVREHHTRVALQASRVVGRDPKLVLRGCSGKADLTLRVVPHVNGDRENGTTGLPIVNSVASDVALWIRIPRERDRQSSWCLRRHSYKQRTINQNNSFLHINLLRVPVSQHLGSRQHIHWPRRQVAESLAAPRACRCR